MPGGNSQRTLVGGLSGRRRVELAIVRLCSDGELANLMITVGHGAVVKHGNSQM